VEKKRRLGLAFELAVLKQSFNASSDLAIHSDVELRLILKNANGDRFARSEFRKF
jgi:hypothetical protein